MKILNSIEDVYDEGKIEKNTIIKADCLEAMHHIEDSSVDMVFCDLPYGTTGCKWDEVLPFDKLWEHYKRIVKDKGAIVLTASQPFTSALIMSNPEMFRYCWVWDKVSVSNPQLAKKQPLKHHEDVCVFSKKPHLYYPQGLIEIEDNREKKERSSTELLGHIKRRSDYRQTHTNYPKSIIRFPRESKPVHPTQKPVSLCKYMIETYSKKGDLILDNTAGSGPVLKACLELDRNFILIEKEEEYFNLIKNIITPIKS